MNHYFLFILAVLGLGSFDGSAYGQRASLKIITYNIYQGMRLDTTENKAKFTAWVRKQDPDILALQEAKSFSQSELENLAEEYGHPYAVLLKEAGTPVALTAKYPIVNVRRIIDNMHHGFLMAEIHGLSVLVTHLSPFTFWERRKEADLILATILSQPPDKDWVLLGDFNAISPADAAYYKDGKLAAQKAEDEKRYDYHENLVNGQLDYKVIEKIMDAGFTDVIETHRAGYDYTYPTSYGHKKKPYKAMQRIDYIFVSDMLADQIIKAAIIKDDFTDLYSDHYPVMAELDLQDN